MSMKEKEVPQQYYNTKMITRLTVLGGSSVYIPVFLSALMQNNVRIKEIVLVGKNSEKLNIVTSFCKRMVDNIGYPVQIKETTSIENGIEGAQIILSHIRVGGFLARIDYEKRPVNYDLIGDESFGAGSFLNAFYTIPVMLEIGKKISSINPTAHLINMTNPMGLVVETLTRFAGLNHVIGICETSTSYKRIISQLFNISEKHIRIQYIGLYHLGAICDVYLNGKSIMIELIDKLEKENIPLFNKELISTFNIIPSRALNIFLRKSDYLKEQKKKSQFRSELLYEHESKILSIYKDPRITTIPDVVYERNPSWYDEIIIPLICALQRKNPEEHIVCIPNKDYLSEFPFDTSVEIPCEINNKGLKPCIHTKLPEVFRGLLLTAKESDRLIIESIVNKSYNYALKALTINPFVDSFDKAKLFLDEFIQSKKIKWFK